MNISELLKNHYYELIFMDKKINLQCKRKFYNKKELESFINKWDITHYKINQKPIKENDDYFIK